MSQATSNEAVAPQRWNFALRTRWAWIVERLSNRPDTEHEVTINRVLLSFAFLIYLIVASYLGQTTAEAVLSHMALSVLPIYEFCVLGLFVHMLISPGVSRTRRLLAIPLDVCFFSYMLYYGDDSTASLYPIYLWTIFGNGFRYGVGYLYVAVVVAVLGFGAVIGVTPFWRTHLALAFGLMAGLIILPAYAATLIRKLSEAKQIAEEASRAKTMFLASVSHELRTPLNAIIGLSDLLGDARLDAGQIDMVHTIGRSGRSLLSLINSILDVSRMEVGKTQTRRERVDLYALLNDVNDMLAVQARIKSIRFALNIAADTPRHIMLNAGHIEEMLVNLGGNAVKFTSQGFVMIHVAALSVEASRCRLRFEVMDTGIGIAPDAQARIFESFAQADSSIIDQYGGTGLGLAIVKQLVEAYGGKIGVDSTIGTGSTFWFELDCDIAPANESQAAAPHRAILVSDDAALCDLFAATDARFLIYHDADTALASLSPADNEDGPVVFLDQSLFGYELDAACGRFEGDGGGRKRALVAIAEPGRWPMARDLLVRFRSGLKRPVSAQAILSAVAIASVRSGSRASLTLDDIETTVSLDVLVAEDNTTNQLVVRKLLERAGHKVTLASNGEEALEHMGRTRFDVVFMDVNMPVLNGIEAAKLARFVEVGDDHVPIVALTADVTEATRARCAEAGMDDCMAKPIDAPKLLGWLAQLAKAKQANAPAALPLASAADVESVEPEVDAGLSVTVEPVDVRTIADLEKLGGHDFVEEIVEQFVEDAAAVLKRLSKAVMVGDDHAFREQAHALRSCAANVGAQRVFQLCLEWRAIDAKEVATLGEQHVRQLEVEFERAKVALANYNG